MVAYAVTTVAFALGTTISSCMMEPGGLWWGCPDLQCHTPTPRTARRVRILAKISLIWVAVMLRS